MLKPIPDAATEKAQEALARTDAEGQRVFSQVKIDPETGAVLARDIADHTKWTRV